MSPKAFEQVLRENKAYTAYANRQEALHTLQTAITKLDKLALEERIKFSRFSRLENELNAKISRLRELHSILIRTILTSEPLLMGNEDMGNDSATIEGTVDNCLDSLDKMRQRSEIQQALQESKPSINGNECLSDVLKYMQDENVKQNKQMTDLISSLSKNQSDNITSLITKQDEHMGKLVTNSSSAAPKPVQPMFKSEENDSDYENYRDFLPRFEHFVNKVTMDKYKLEWLKSSISGDAFSLVKNLDLVDSNYKIALDKLANKYLNNDYIKEKLIGSVLEFKCDKDIEVNKVPSVVTALTNNLDVLKNSHGIDFYSGSGMELVRCTLFNNLPNEVKKGLIFKTGKNFPNLDEILTNLQKVVNTIGIINTSSAINNSSNSDSESNLIDSNDEETQKVVLKDAQTEGTNPVTKHLL